MVRRAWRRPRHRPAAARPISPRRRALRRAPGASASAPARSPPSRSRRSTASTWRRRCAPSPSLPYKVDTSRPSLRTNWTRLVPFPRQRCGRRTSLATPWRASRGASASAARPRSMRAQTASAPAGPPRATPSGAPRRPSHASRFAPTASRAPRAPLAAARRAGGAGPLAEPHRRAARGRAARAPAAAHCCSSAATSSTRYRPTSTPHPRSRTSTRPATVSPRSPDALLRCAALRTLALENNALTQLDPRLALLPALRALAVDGNPLRSVRRAVLAQGSDALLALLRNRLPERAATPPAAAENRNAVQLPPPPPAGCARGAPPPRGTGLW